MQTSDYLEQLVQDKNDLVDNLTEMGIEGLTGDETFTELVPEVLNIESGDKGWERPSDWWDTETILANAEERQDDNDDTVYPAYIILLDDSDKQTTFSKTTTNKALQGDAYLTSDGTWYGDVTTDPIHTWDESKDKACSKGYKTRYVIVYMKTPISPSATTATTIDLSNFLCLEVVFDNFGHYISFTTTGNQGNSKIQNIVATNNATIYLSTYSFTNCVSLKSVSFPNLLTLQGSFSGCVSLEKVYIPNLTSTSSYTFSGCNSLKEVSFPNLKKLSRSDFNSTALERIELPNVTTVPNYSSFDSCKLLKSVSLPKVTTLPADMFNGCNSLREVSFPHLITLNKIFKNCYSLETITIPDTIQTIPTTSTTNSPAFSPYLKSIILPENFALNINLNAEISLTHSALVDIIDKLKDLTGTQETHTITLGATNEAKLSADELAVITSKGWTLGS